jgi:hypothetical protein
MRIREYGISTMIVVVQDIAEQSNQLHWKLATGATGLSFACIKRG